MTAFYDIFGNRVLVLSLIAWAIAQSYKVAVILLREKRLDLRTFGGSGGMPSSHTALVFALSTAVALTRGFDSVEFAISGILTMIVTYDAAGVRRAVSRQAVVLNRLIKEAGAGRPRGKVEQDLRELIGHTPMQVVMGALLGIAVSVIGLIILGG